MDAYDNYAACGRLNEFVDALSNWYVRRSRDRFWSSEPSADKPDAYWTLYECLLDDRQADRPVRAVPGRGDVAEPGRGGRSATGRRRASTSATTRRATRRRSTKRSPQRMALVREIVSLGRSARMGAKLKVRQPLARVEVVLADATHQAWLEEHAALICEELNVKQVEFIAEGRAVHHLHGAAGPEAARPAAGQAAAGAAQGAGRGRRRPAAGRTGSRGQGHARRCPTARSTLDSDDLQVRLQAKEGWAAAQGHACVVVLSTELTDELIARRARPRTGPRDPGPPQGMDCEYTDRIAIGVVTDSRGTAGGGRAVSRTTSAAKRWPSSSVLEAIAGVEPVEAGTGRPRGDAVRQGAARRADMEDADSCESQTVLITGTSANVLRPAMTTV